MNKIIIQTNPNGDTRTAPPNVTLEEFYNANLSHIIEVNQLMCALSEKLSAIGVLHDKTKITEEQMFYEQFVEAKTKGTNFTESEWYQMHIRKERHHPTSYCHDDINLIDILEMMCDCVAAGLARSGEVRPLEISDEILKKAFNNTAKLIENMCEVQSADQQAHDKGE